MGQIVTRVDLSSLERISQNEYRSHLRVPVSAARSIPEDLSAHRLNFSPHLDVRA